MAQSKRRRTRIHTFVRWKKSPNGEILQAEDIRRIREGTNFLLLPEESIRSKRLLVEEHGNNLQFFNEQKIYDSNRKLNKKEHLKI